MPAEPQDQDGPPEPGPPPERDQLAEGVEHLQAAAKELIRAGRSLLDAVEGLVEDPAALQGVVATLGSLAQAAARSLRPDGEAAGDGAGDDGAGDDGKVQRIPLS
jgi:hypothetical protein